MVVFLKHLVASVLVFAPPTSYAYFWEEETRPRLVAAENVIQLHEQPDIFQWDQFSTDAESKVLSHLFSVVQTQREDRPRSFCAYTDGKKIHPVFQRAISQYNAKLTTVADNEVCVFDRPELNALLFEKELDFSATILFRRGDLEIIDRITERVAEAAGLPLDHGDYAQMLKYETKKSYAGHTDCQNAGAPPKRSDREATFLLYLNSVESGGETRFPSLGGKRNVEQALSVKPERN